jgi:competence protein ComEC
MPLLWLSLAFFCGILTAGWSGLGRTEVGRLIFLCAALLSTVLIIVMRRLPVGRWTQWARRDPRLKFPPLLLGLLFCLGGLRYSLANEPPGLNDLAWYNDKGEVLLSGWVSSDPSRRDRTTLLRVEVDRLVVADPSRNRVHGTAQVMLPPGEDWQYGDRVLLLGKPQTPPVNEDFSYRDYLAAQGVHALLSYPRITHEEGQAGSAFLRWIYSVRRAGLALLERLYPAPEAQLLQGILLGVDENIPTAVADDFRATGLAHVIAISGFNMSILSGLFLSLFKRVFTRWSAALLAILALAVYSLLAGAGPSVVRAAIMSALAIAAGQLGRAGGGVNALMLAAGGMCLFNPNLPWDAGFQLSFAATLGLLFYAGPMQSWAEARIAAWSGAVWAKRLSAPLGEYLLCTLAAQAATLPLIAWHFQRISISALLSNPLVLPAQSPLMVFGGLSLLGGLFWEPLARLLAWPAWLCAAWSVRTAQTLAQIPFGEIHLGQTGAWLVPAGCAFLFLVLALRNKLAVWKLRFVYALLPLAALTALIMRVGLSGADGRTHVYIFDLPGGPALLLRSPEGGSLLIGGSDSQLQLEEALGRRLPPGARLDGMIIPSGFAQKGLPAIVERFHPDRVLLCPTDTGLRAGLERAVETEQIPLEVLEAGNTLSWGSLRIGVLSGTDRCPLAIQTGDLRLLLPGRVSPEELMVEPGWFVISNRQDGWNKDDMRVLTPQPDGWLHLQMQGSRLYIETNR